MTLDAFSWARWQLDLDARENGRFPEILERKSAKLANSPFSFFRGTAPLFYASLAEDAGLFRVPSESGFVVGDAHLENFGAFRVVSEETEAKSIVFDVNDFDEVGVAPLAVDPVRLGASLLLAARELRISGAEAARLAVKLIDAYARGASGDTASEKRPDPIRKLFERAEKRSKRDFLDKRTALVASRRRFVRGERYADVRASWSKSLEEAVVRYAASLSAPESFPSGARELEDVAFRIAGTGSLGCVRLASLHAGKGGDEGKWLFDWKEERQPALAVLSSKRGDATSGRILRGMRTFLPKVPRMLGEALIDFEGVGPRTYVVRRLTPQEDKLDLASLEASALPDLVEFLGEKLGSAHARANDGTSLRFDATDRAAFLESATRVAGLFEAVFLAYCVLAVETRA